MKFSKKKKITGFTDEKHEADDDLPSPPPYPLPFSLHLVFIQNVPVYAGTTRTC